MLMAHFVTLIEFDKKKKYHRLQKAKHLNIYMLHVTRKIMRLKGPFK